MIKCISSQRVKKQIKTVSSDAVLEENMSIYLYLICSFEACFTILFMANVLKKFEQLSLFVFKLNFSFWAGIHKMLVRIANREDPDQNSRWGQSLRWVCAVLCGKQLVFKILEHLPELFSF